MKKTLSAIIIVIIFAAPFEVCFADNSIRLICKYTHSIDEKGQPSGTSGEDLITIHYTDTGRATIQKQDLGAKFYGTINEENIYGETQYKLRDSIVHQTIEINRYTGAFQITFNIDGKKGSLAQYGKCVPARKKLF